MTQQFVPGTQIPKPFTEIVPNPERSFEQAAINFVTAIDNFLKHKPLNTPAAEECTLCQDPQMAVRFLEIVREVFDTTGYAVFSVPSAAYVIGYMMSEALVVEDLVKEQCPDRPETGETKPRDILAKLIETMDERWIIGHNSPVLHQLNLFNTAYDAAHHAFNRHHLKATQLPPGHDSAPGQ